MNHPEIRDMTAEDAADVIALNKAVVQATSPMDADRFHVLFALCDFKLVAKVNGEVAAFVMGIASGRGYENGNYKWFSMRMNSFLYIDRVVVSDVCRGLGVGRRLYSRAYDWAMQFQLLMICAEMNIDPPNPASLRFHEKAGFVRIGTRLSDQGKRVSMQIRAAPEDSANPSPV